MNALSDEFIKIVKQRTAGKGTAAFLCEMLHLGREAVYRRLRGEVPFTLEEAVTICRKLSISMDLLAGIQEENIFAFHVDTFLSDNPVEEYCAMLDTIYQSIAPLLGDPTAKLYQAHKTMPQLFMYKYEMLSRMYLYILHYQQNINRVDVPPLIENFFSDKVTELQKRSAELMHMFDSVIILDKCIIPEFIGIVKYFQLLEMIPESFIAAIKEELFQMLADMEQCADEGKSLNGNKMDIYLCHIGFDCTYVGAYSEYFEASSVGVYCIDFLSSENKRVHQVHLNWIRALINFSSLISVIDEKTRRDYFRQQRQYIETMLN